MAFSFVDSTLIVGIALRSMAVIVLTAAIGFALRRRSSAVQHAIWAVGMTGCSAMPVVLAFSPGWSLPLLTEDSGISVESFDVVTSTVPVSPPLIYSATSDGNRNGSDFKQSSASQAFETSQHVLSEGPAGIKHQPPIPGLSSSRRFPLESAVMWIWRFGFGVVVLRLIQQLVVVRLKVHHAKSLNCDQWHAQREIAAQALGVRANVVLKQDCGSYSPMVIGVFRPVIVLPADSETWSSDRRMLVLLHELAHVKRLDLITQTIAHVACALNWFNPICWYGLAQMRKHREMACDDLVLMSGQRATDYADVLLDVARRYRHHRVSPAVGMAHSSSVETRILAILDRARNRVALTRRAFRLSLLSAVATVLVLGSLRLHSRADQPTAPDQLPGDSEVQLPAQVARENESLAGDEEFRHIEVQITDEADQPLEGAKLYIGVWYTEGYEGEKVPKQYLADSRGIIQVKLPRRLRILRMWPSNPGFVPLFVNFSEGAHEEGRLIPDQYKFQLRKGQRLSGRVVDESGNPVPNAKVQVRVDVNEPAWGARPAPMIGTWLTDSDFSSPTPVTDSEGRWSITNAPAPPDNGKDNFEFQLQVTHPDFAGDTRWGELQGQQGIKTEDLRAGTATLTLRSGVSISGEIVGPEGQPVTRGWVVWSDEPYHGDGVWEAELKPDGSFRTPPLQPGEYPVTIIAPGFAAQRRVVQVASDSSNLRFELRPGKRIEIRFVDAAGNSIPKAVVLLASSSNDNTWNGSNALHNHEHPNVPDYGIPQTADEKGIFVWDWAPEESVKYTVGSRGFAEQEVRLVAGTTTHIITLAATRVVSGLVTDAVSGEPIRNFQAMPVIVFRPDFYHTRTTDAKVGENGHYELPLTGSGDPNDHYRVRFEADGYRSIVSTESFGPLDGRVTLNYSMQPAPSRKGRVVDAEGRPVENATVLEASPTDIPNVSDGEPDSWGSRPTSTDLEGTFQFRATTEPVLVRVYHDTGFAEKALAPEAVEFGVVTLQPWATVSGRLLQAGQPVADQRVYFYPHIQPGLTEARFQDSNSAKTDANGNFRFDRLPLTKGSIRALLGPWRESPLTSSESIPVELSSAEHREIMLGGDGAVIKGRVVATGRNNDDLSKQWSLNHLVSRNTEATFLKETESLSFDHSGPLQPAWLRLPDFNSWLATRQNYFVKLAKDGQLQIHGVEPGEYDLVIRLYEQPAGCLVETIGEKVVPVVITPEHVAAGQVDIGDIEVQCRIGPRVGSDMRAFQITDVSGRQRYIDDLKGQHILLHAWATWCAPCLASMPTLKATTERYSASPLTVVGLNVDEDTTNAQTVAGQQKMDWAQNYLGSDSDLMRQLAVSSVPAYYLIGPDGKLIGSANEWEQMEKLMSTALE